MLSFVGGPAVQVEHDKDEGGNDGRERAKEVGIGDKQEPFEFIMLVRSNCDSFCFFDEVETRPTIVYLELVDSFLLRSLNYKTDTWNSAR